MPLATGQKLGAYEILDFIGKGGMGEVYRARDTKLDRSVAVKVLSNEIANPDARRRFQREAQMASSLNHPHILTVHDAGELEGRQYLVTEFVDGGTLKDWAKAQRRTWKQVVELLTGVADGLAAAHAAGILHRDIKPANILVAKNGYAKLADFGLAKLVEPAELDATETLTGAHTRTGVVMGTIAYMSPEQASGKTIDVRSDIFSFGVVLYELLAASRPFSGKTESELMQSIIHGTPEALAEDIPVALRLAVEKALANDPAERYQAMRELVVDLRRVMKQGPEPKAKATPPSRRGFRWAWAALIPLLALAGYFGWHLARSPRSEQPLRAVAIATLPGGELYPTLAPDGDRVAFMWTGPNQDNADVYVQQIGSGSPLRLTTDPHNDFSPRWSPDGRWIAFLRHEFSAAPLLTPSSGSIGKAELRLIPPLGGAERKVVDLQAVGYDRAAKLAWCPESDCLVAADAGGLFSISLETGDKRTLTPPGSLDSDPAVSPNGRFLAFRRSTSVSSSEIYWLPLGKGAVAAGEPKALTNLGRAAGFPAWMPDGKEILFSASGSLWSVPISAEKAGDIQPARLPFIGEDGIMPVISLPRPGKGLRLVYVRSLNDFNIWRINTPAVGGPSPSPPAVSISSTRRDYTPAFSPDGRRVAFASDRAGDMEIWLCDADGSNASQLTFSGGTSVLPSWSPDGQQIAFHSDVEKQFEIYVVPVSGGKPRRLTFNPANDGFPSFSGDGRWVYFGSNRTGRNEVWKVPVSGGDAVQITHDGGVNPTESQDGAYLYYTRGTLVNGSLWRVPVNGGDPARVLDGLYNVGYAVIPKGIYYVNRPAGETRLQFLDFATGKTTTVANDLGITAASKLTASPDGRTILYVRMDSSIDDLMLVENFK